MKMIDMSTQHKHLEKAGECDYDYSNDVLFFKVKDREYAKSIELDNVVLDVDEENFIVGMQIFNPSELFNLSKESLRSVRNWRFQASVEQNRLEVKLVFQTMFRNKLVEPRPILIEPLKHPLPNSRIVCTAP